MTIGGDPQNQAQRAGTLLGKILRIDVNVPDADQQGYRIPPDNPFAGNDPLGALDEIWAFGVRNPWRFTFDPTWLGGTGAAVIGDVGQNQFEELDYTTVGRAKGANFGWDALEGFDTYEDENSGTSDPGGTIKPIFAYPHSRGSSCSITGSCFMVLMKRL